MRNSRDRIYQGALLLILVVATAIYSHASSGTEGAAFLDIPVGAGPAALGGSYSSLARDAYAPTYNAAGLGALESIQLSAQHLSYLDSLHYEYFSFVYPLPKGDRCVEGAECLRSALGASVQYLGTGNDESLNDAGNRIGEFSSYYASYNFSYGRALTNKLSLGLTAKMIQAKLDDVGAHAFATDLGVMYRYNSKLDLSSTLNNVGSKIKFIDQSDPLPLAFRVGAAYRPWGPWLFTSEVAYFQTGLAAFQIGSEWKPWDMLALRAGYRTDVSKELSSLAGFSMGFGVELWGHELGYAWVPYGDLGDTHYVSLLMKFGQRENERRNLIQYQDIKRHRSADRENEDPYRPEYQQIMQLMEDSDKKMAQQANELSNSAEELK